MTTVVPDPPRVATCACTARHRDHHDRLLAVDRDPDALLELFELAVTWHELDYSAEPVLGPREWMTFADDHRWLYPDRAAWAFALAVDVVGRRAVGPPPVGRDATVLDLIRS
jgi:RimJ/RimL family protein N-acetyltransferase